MDSESDILKQAKSALWTARQDANFYKGQASTAVTIANDLYAPYISLQIINDNLIEMMQIAQAAKASGRDVSATIKRLLSIFFEVDKLSLIQSENHSLRHTNTDLRIERHNLKSEISDLKRQLQLHTGKL